MRKTVLTGIMCLCAAVQSVVAQPQNSGETADHYNQRMEWFGKAKLGIFIHWGIYAVKGVSESWSFHNNQIAYDDYMAQAKDFTASHYDPEAWADLIKESGAQYTVITTKHHDGFALWDTKAGKISAKKCSPARRDLITPFAEAIRKRGLHLGLYYSLLDWSHKDYPNMTKTVTRYDIKQDPKRWERFCTFNFAQLRELNTTFKPDLYWFDGDWEQTAQDWHADSIVKMLRSTNPDVVINSRIQGYGDYATPELGIPVVKPESRYWELCYTINDSWGFQHADTNFKPFPVLLQTFVDCLSMGGNLLLDIGPKADGTIPEEEVSVLKAFGRWISKHKEAVYDTRSGLPYDHFHGYSALNKAGDVVYLYLPYRPTGPLQLKGIVNDVRDVRIVGSDVRPSYTIYNKISWSEVPGVLYVNVPDEALDPDMTVVAIHLDGPVRLYRGHGQVITMNE